MESKKINQLATELAPVLSDLTIIGDPTTGISKKITLSQMASLFTGTVEEYPNLASFPLVGTADTIYIALDTNVLYRWNTGTNAYVELSPNIINSLVFNDANGFDGTIALVGSVATLTITTALTTGSVGFIGASGALLQDNANFFWDDTNNRLGLGTNAPTTAIDVFGSGIIGRLNGTSTNNAFLGFASAGSNKWSIGNVQSDHRFRIYSETNTSELISVLQTGEFGIGIVNPTTKLHIDGGASALIANLDANVSIAKSISFRSDNSNRINLEVSGTESGSNAGANFFIRRYSDAGALIDTPLTITRSTGTAMFGGTVQFGTTSGFTTAKEGEFFSKSGGSMFIGDILADASTLKAYVIQRNDVERFSIGLNASDNLAFINASGTSVGNISSTGIATFLSEISGTNVVLTSNSSSLKRDINTSYLELTGGGDSTSGQAQIRLYGKTSATFAGSSQYYADNLYIYNSTSPNTFKAVFDSNGRLGINNQTPLLGLHVEKGLSSSPSTSGTTPNGLVIFKPSDGSNALLFGAYASAPNGLWIQGQSTAGLGTNFPIYINPNGGNVAIGGIGISRRLQVNTSGNDGIRILTSGDNPTLDMMQTAAANAAARNWRIVTNWEGWGTLDFQSGTTNTQDPATTRLSIKGTTGDVGIGGTAWNKLTIYTSSTNAFDVFDTGSGFGIGMQAINNLNSVYRTWDFYASKYSFFVGTLHIGDTSGYTTIAKGQFFSKGGGSMFVSNALSGGAAKHYTLQRNDATIFHIGGDGSDNLAFINASDTYVGYINKTSGVYVPTSDFNKKKDFEVYTTGLNAILGLKPTLYRMKEDEDNCKKHLGFIAQEVKEFIPHAFVNNGDFIGLDYNPIVATIVKAIQELNNKFESLKN
jgi:hypothetical protein